LSKVKLGENYPRAKRNPLHSIKVIRSNIEIAIRHRLLNCIQIWYKASSRHRGYIANVQGQRPMVKVTGSKVNVTA